MVPYRFLCVLLCASLVASELQENPGSREQRQIHFTHGPHHHSTPATATASDPLSQWIASAASHSSPSERPNVLFLVVDDLLPRLGCYGESMLVTPNIDQLAGKSVLFQRAYAQQALCGPSRTSFLTGRRPESTRVFDLNTYWRDVAGNFTTLPEYFKRHGYFTQGIGKVFHPGNSGEHDDGKYSWSGPSYRGKQPFSFAERHTSTIQPVDEAKSGPLQDTTIADYAVDWLNNRSQAHHQGPFFLAVGFHKPHLPFLYPQLYKALYPLDHVQLAKHRTKPPHTDDVVFSGNHEFHMFGDIQNFNQSDSMDPLPDSYQLKLRQAYSAAISFTDSLVGRVLEALQKNGFANNTIISFHGDHGYHLGDNALWSKHTNFEAATRIPMLMHVPGVTSLENNFHHVDALAGVQTAPAAAAPPKRRQSALSAQAQAQLPALVTDKLVEAVDLFPTLAELAGLPTPRTCPQDNLRVHTCVEGASLVPLLRNVIGGSSSSSGGAGSQLPWKEAAFSLHTRLPQDTPPASPNVTLMGYSVRTARHRYGEWVEYDLSAYRPNFSHVVARELYVHATDPDEFYNVADDPQMAAVARSLSDLLRAGWRATLNKYLIAAGLG